MLNPLPIKKQSKKWIYKNGVINPLITIENNQNVEMQPTNIKLNNFSLCRQVGLSEYIGDYICYKYKILADSGAMLLGNTRENNTKTFHSYLGGKYSQASTDVKIDKIKITDNCMFIAIEGAGKAEVYEIWIEKQGGNS